MKFLRKRGLHMFRKRSDQIQNTHNDYMNIVVNIGCLILLRFFRLVVLLGACLFRAFCHIYMIVLKVWLTVSQKLIGFRCWAVVSASVSAFAVRMISRLESCRIFAHMTHHLSLIDKVGLAVVLMLHILIFPILIFSYFLK